MTAREFKELIDTPCLAAIIAERAGVSRSAFDKRVHKDHDMQPEELPRLAKEIQKLAFHLEQCRLQLFMAEKGI